MTGHGGNIYGFAEGSGLSEKNIIDFSASINPLGVPKTVRTAIKDNIGRLCHYPDSEAVKLRTEIAGDLHINSESVVCGNGSTELIYLVARALSPERVLIPAPTFSEYERACKTSCKLQVTSYKLKNKNSFDIDPDEFIEAMDKMVNSALRTSPSAFADMVFLCNPNNPTGRLISKKDVLKIASAARKLRCYLVVDEAFIDFVPEHSVCRAVEGNPYLIVLRSLTKFYALSGLRLGYGVFPLTIVKLITKYKEPWTVNTIAQQAGIAAIKDKKYIERTFIIMSREKRFMETGFKKLGISFLPSAVNYYLIRVREAGKVTNTLQGKGILVRDCSNFRGLHGSYIRVAVKSRADNMKLLQELSCLCTA